LPQKVRDAGLSGLEEHLVRFQDLEIDQGGAFQRGGPLGPGRPGQDGVVAVRQHHHRVGRNRERIQRQKR
jgi:hypothetical protein